MAALTLKSSKLLTCDAVIYFYINPLSTRTKGVKLMVMVIVTIGRTFM